MDKVEDEPLEEIIVLEVTQPLQKYESSVVICIFNGHGLFHLIYTSGSTQLAQITMRYLLVSKVCL
jgi:hypothetical protein